MDKKRLEHFKKLLEAEKKNLEAELGDIAKHNHRMHDGWQSTYPKMDADSGYEEATDEAEEYINRIPVEQSLEEKLNRVKHALDRIKNGSYGVCENCKRTIPQKRLEAVPETNVCLECEKRSR